jgi:SAM-dependent methyltransferase
MSEYSIRVQREQDSFNDGSVRAGQRKLGAVLSHVDYGPSRRRRDCALSDAVRTGLSGAMLEIGSHAWANVFWREQVQPANLTCINISQRELDAGCQEARDHGFKAQFKLMDAHKLEFSDASFEMVYGVAILHHLEFERALCEIARVLRPGGTAVFVEPLRLNPVAMLVRLMTPWARTIDERPLGPAELRLVERYFRTSSVYSDLFTVPAGLASRFLCRTPDNSFTRTADRLDRAIASTLPWMRPLFRTVTLIGQKREQALG